MTTFALRWFEVKRVCKADADEFNVYVNFGREPLSRFLSDPPRDLAAYALLDQGDSPATVAAKLRKLAETLEAEAAKQAEEA